ncbi:MAG: type IX secretion system membrane protein PorP/SprF [Bacteroidales bacterium]|jgi:type IX secretion system PorP/SprF family membrane protein|nr:type IX secretion system membrane protein PorP/SprF [Bacteroidales bacterium]
MIKNFILRKVMLFAISIGVVFSAYSQDPHFSQYYANPLYLNPALAGATICPRLNLNYRNQWASISGQYVTYNASYDQHIDALSGGIGLLVTVDKAGEGVLNTTMASGIYSFKLDINRKLSLKAGFQATFHQKSIDWPRLTFPDMIDYRSGFVYNTNETSPDKQTISKADFATGLVLYSDRFYGGFAVHHLTRPDEGFIGVSRIPLKYTLHAGGNISVEDNNSRKRTIEETAISPNLMYQKQAKFDQVNFGLYLNKYPFVGGIWYRHTGVLEKISTSNPDAVILLVGFVQPTFRFGYSYDITVSRLSNASGGSHEFSLAFQFDCFPKQKRVRPISCPIF